MNLNNLGLARKLTGAIALLLAAMLAIGGFTLLRAQAIERQASEAIEQAQTLIRKSVKWQGMTETAVARSMAAAVSKDPAVGELFKEAMATDTPRVVKLREEITKEAQTPEDQTQLKQIVGFGGSLLAASKKARELGAAGDSAGAAKVVQEEYGPAVRSYLGAIERFVQMQADKASKAEQAAVAARTGLLWMGAIGALLIVVFNSAYGVINARKQRVMAARVMGASRWQVFKDVLIWESLQPSFVGLRSAVSMALVIVIVAEMFIGADSGLGNRIINSQQVMNVKDMYASILAAGALGYALNILFLVVERRIVHWSGR